MNFSSNRWVLLHHQVGERLGDRGDHYDFMVSPVDSVPAGSTVRVPCPDRFEFGKLDFSRRAAVVDLGDPSQSPRPSVAVGVLNKTPAGPSGNLFRV